MSEIRLAQFVVADFTCQRGGLYFVAGFARDLGREVIWSCRREELKLVHFDIKHLGHVVWETPADLRAKVAESIRANNHPETVIVMQRVRWIIGRAGTVQRADLRGVTAYGSRGWGYTGVQYDG
jgi:hypothetical protein